MCIGRLIAALAVLGLSGCAWGQPRPAQGVSGARRNSTTAEPTQSATIRMRQGNKYPWVSTVYPQDIVFDVQHDRAWEAQITGTLATACQGPCLAVQPARGFGPGPVRVLFNAKGAEMLPVGAHAGWITAGASTLRVTLNVEPRQEYLHFVYPPGYPKACGQSESGYPHQDTCHFENYPAGVFPAPAPGESYQDPQFGTTVTRLTEPGFTVAYSAVSAFSAASTYVMATNLSGNSSIYTRAGQLVTENIPVNFNSFTWDARDDNRIWTYDGATVRSYQVREKLSTVAADFSRPFDERPAFQRLDAGGTADGTADGWWVFVERDARRVCAINLNGLTPRVQHSQLYCADYSALDIQNVDFPQITQVDSESGKRYVVLLGTPRALVFSVGERGLDLEYVMPKGFTTQHSDVSEDSQGRQVVLFGYEDTYGNRIFLATARLNRGTSLLRPVEEGGGLSLLYPIHGGTIPTDFHYGCNWNGYCVVSSYSSYQGRGVPNVALQALVPRPGACSIQTAEPHGMTAGSFVVIAGDEDRFPLAGRWPVTAVTDTEFTIPRPCPSSSALVPGLAWAGWDKPWFPHQPNRQEVTVLRLDGEVRRLAIHRAVVWRDNGKLKYYYSTPRASISSDGRYVAYTSNLGSPQPGSIYWAAAPWPSGPPLRLTDLRWEDGQATFAWEGADVATLMVSERRDFETTAYQGKVPSGQVVRGLEPGKQYFFQLHAESRFFQGEFTLPDPGSPGPASRQLLPARRR
jgi:hypothetical protein